LAFSGGLLSGGGLQGSCKAGLEDKYLKLKGILDWCDSIQWRLWIIM